MVDEKTQQELSRIQGLIDSISKQLSGFVTAADEAVQKAFSSMIEMQNKAIHLETDLAKVKPHTVNYAMAGINNQLTDLQFVQIRLTEHQSRLRRAKNTLMHLIGLKKAKLKTSDALIRRQEAVLRDDFTKLHCVDEDGLLVEVSSALENITSAIKAVAGMKDLFARTTQDAKYQHKIIAGGDFARLGESGSLQAAEARAAAQKASASVDPIEEIAAESFSDIDESIVDTPEEALGIRSLVEEPADDEVAFVPGEFQQDKSIVDVVPESVPEPEPLPEPPPPPIISRQEAVESVSADTTIGEIPARPGPAIGGLADEEEPSDAEVYRSMGINSKIIEIGLTVYAVVDMFQKRGVCSIGKASEYLGFKDNPAEETVRDFIRYWCLERGFVEKEGSRSYKLGPKHGDFEILFNEAKLRCVKAKKAIREHGLSTPAAPAKPEIDLDQAFSVMFGGTKKSQVEENKKAVGEIADANTKSWDDVDKPAGPSPEKTLPVLQLEAKADEQVDPDAILEGNTLPATPAPEPKKASERDKELEKYQEAKSPEPTPAKVNTEQETFSIDDFLGGIN